MKTRSAEEAKVRIDRKPNYPDTFVRVTEAEFNGETKRLMHNPKTGKYRLEDILMEEVTQ